MAGRIGARRFLSTDRCSWPSGSSGTPACRPIRRPWQASIHDPATLVPPATSSSTSFPCDPAFGVGISCVVAPLTSDADGLRPRPLSRVSARRSTTPSSRVGQPLLGALIFIASSATFYATLGDARARARHRLDTVRAGVPAAQPATGRAPPAHAAAATHGVDRCVPPRDVRACAACSLSARRVVVGRARGKPRYAHAVRATGGAERPDR